MAAAVGGRALGVDLVAMVKNLETVVCCNPALPRFDLVVPSNSKIFPQVVQIK